MMYVKMERSAIDTIQGVPKYMNCGISPRSEMWIYSEIMTT